VWWVSTPMTPSMVSVRMGMRLLLRLSGSHAGAGAGADPDSDPPGPPSPATLAARRVGRLRGMGPDVGWRPAVPTDQVASPEDAARYAAALARGCAEALGEAAVGMILHGSLTLDDYVPGRSDVDLLVVVRGALTDARLAALAEAVGARRSQAPGRVDLRLVTRQVAAAPSPAPPMEAYVEITPGSGLHMERRHPGERDLVVEFSMCRAHGRSLRGPGPTELIGAVPDSWVVDVGDAQLADWQAIGDDPEHAELTVLTACRVWRFSEEGRHCSKTAAGEWALRCDPTLQVVRDALRRRHGDPTAPLDAARIGRLLGIVRARLAERRAGA
jgi:Domain of unknown function (DUF4111)